MAHEQFQEMLAVHALSALDERDELALNEHLQSCAECRDELDQWRKTSSGLAFMSTPAEPSPKVRERILAQVRSEKDSPASPSNVLPFAERRRSQIYSPRRFGALEAVAATIIVALLISVFVLWRQNRATKNDLARLSQQIRDTQIELDHQQAIVKMMSQPGSRLIDLGGTNMAPGARAKIVYDKNGSAMLVAEGLPATPAGMAYQLWYVVGDKKMPGKTFGIDASGKGNLHDQIPSSAMEGAVFAVTMEPAGGGTTPTGKMYLVSNPVVSTRS
jgi:anti-sigma-K factor RskA